MWNIVFIVDLLINLNTGFINDAGVVSFLPVYFLCYTTVPIVMALLPSFVQQSSVSALSCNFFPSCFLCSPGLVIVSEAAVLHGLWCAYLLV